MSELTDIPLVVEEAVSRLSKGLGAETIYLFGSRVENRASPGSDYDLLVVVPDSVLPRHQREAKSYDLLWGLITPFDVIVLTRDEFARQVKVKTSLAATASTKGLILYGLPQAD